MSFPKDSREFKLVSKFYKAGFAPRVMVKRAPSLASGDKHADGSADKTKQIRRTLHIIKQTEKSAKRK